MFNFLEDVKLKKEKEKKRKKIYGEELRLQIEQNKKKKAEEKFKSRQESIRNLQLFQNSSSFNSNTLNNYDKIEDNFHNNFNYLKTSMQNPLINYKFYDNYLNVPNKNNFYTDNKNKFNGLFNNNITNSLNNSYQNTDFNLFRKNNNLKNFLYNSVNYNDNNKNNTINSNNKFFENGKYIMKKSSSSILNLNNKPSLNKNNNFNNINNNDLLPQNDYLNNNNTDNSSFINDNNINFNYINNDNNALMAEINLQFLFREFVEQQIKTINNYENNIEDIFFQQYKNKKNESIKNLIENERNKAIQAIKNEQNKLKNQLGFFPMENNYNYKIEQLFKKILNKKIATYSSIKEMDILLKKLIDRQNIQIELLRYKSKYEEEDIQDSVPNFQKLNINSQKTLRGYSKLVKINDNIKDNTQENNDNNSNINNNDNIKDDANFLESWREQLGKDIYEEKNEKIKINKNENIKLNNNEFDISDKSNNINENIKTFPVTQNFKNVQNRDIIKNKMNNENYNNNNNNNIKTKKNSILNISSYTDYDKRNKSAKNLVYSDKIISKDLNIYNKEYTLPKEFNELNGEETSQKYKDIKSNLIKVKNNKKKGKNSFSFKKADFFMKNAKQGRLIFPKSTKILQKYDNYLNINNERIYNSPETKKSDKSLNSSLNSSHN